MLQLSKYSFLNDAEKQTSVPKVYMAIGVAAVYFFLIFFNIAGEFLVNIAGFIIPGWYSMAALFSTSKTDDTQVSWCPKPETAQGPGAVSPHRQQHGR